MTDFYKSLKTVNDDEQNRLGMLQRQFDAAIRDSNWNKRYYFFPLFNLTCTF